MASTLDAALQPYGRGAVLYVQALRPKSAVPFLLLRLLNPGHQSNLVAVCVVHRGSRGMEIIIYFIIGAVVFKGFKLLRSAWRCREWTPLEEELANAGVYGVEGYAYTQERKEKYYQKQLNKGAFFQRPWNERDREHFIEAYQLHVRRDLGVSIESLPDIAIKARDFYDKRMNKPEDKGVQI